MPRSSIFSFDTLSLDQQSFTHGVVVLVCAISLVGLTDALLRLDHNPKSLPFHNSRIGTIMDVLSRDKQPPPVVLFLGSSQCAYNISPADVWSSWGLTEPVSAINLGMPGCNMRTVNQFRDEFQAYLDARLFVFVCAPLGMNGPPVTSTYDNPGGDYLLKRLPTPEQWLMALHLFRYRRQYRDLRYQYYLLSRRQLEADLDRRLGPFRCGWRPGQGNFLASTDMNQIAGDDDRRDVIEIGDDADVWSSLGETFRRVRASGAQVVCLVPPQPPRFDNAIANPTDTWKSFLSRLEETCKHHAVLLVDHHRLVEFGDESFFDYTHLKNDDARRYSRYVGEQFRDILGPEIRANRPVAHSTDRPL